MARAVRLSSFRIGRRHVLATGAEALCRWAIEQGTLPAAEGGTHVAPLVRLAALAEDPACMLPMAALVPAELTRLRLRRHAALGSAAAVLAEQAALAAAFSALCELYMQDCGNPLGPAAPDGCYLLAEATRDAIAARGAQDDPYLGLALELLRDPAFDALLTGESRFDELPDVMARLAAGSLPALCHTITYGEG